VFYYYFLSFDQQKTVGEGVSGCAHLREKIISTVTKEVVVLDDFAAPTTSNLVILWLSSSFSEHECDCANCCKSDSNCYYVNE
jgi:hypothetical protein